MALNQILKNYAMFVDGGNYVGQVEEFTLPTLSFMTEDVRAAGMAGPEAVIMGIEGMEGSFVMVGYDAAIMRLAGFREGGEVAVSVRGALEDLDGTVIAVRHDMRVKITQIDMGTWKPGEKVGPTYEFKAHYWKHTHDGSTINEVDVRNMVLIVDGYDQLANQRRAIGI